MNLFTFSKTPLARATSFVMTLALTVVLSGGIFVPSAFAATQGPQSPASGYSDDSNGQTQNWSNPTRVVASDDSRTTASLTVGEVSRYLRATGFDFSGIPADAVIYGLTVDLERSGSAAGRIRDNAIEIVTGSATSTNYADTVTLWGTADSVVSYGGPSDLWSLGAVSTSTLLSPNFAVLIAADNTSPATTTSARVDHVTITVTYSQAPSITLTSPVGGEVWNGIQNVAWIGTDPDGSEVPTVDLEYSPDGIGSWTTIVASTTNDGSYFWDTGPVPDGSYVVRATINDGFTTASDASSLITLTTVDNTAPASLAVSAPYASSTPTDVTWSATDATSGVDFGRLFYRFNAGAYAIFGIQPGASGTFSFPFTSGEGTYDFYTQATDVAGNQELAPGVPDSTTIYDFTPPVISSFTAVATTDLGTPGILGIGDVLTFTLTTSALENTLTVNGASSYNGGALVWSQGVGNTWVSTYTVVSVHTDQPGTLDVSGVTVTDAAGNTSVLSASVDVLEPIDANAPTVTTVDSDGATYNIASVSPETIMVTFSEDMGLAPTISVTVDGAQTVNDCSDADAKTFCFNYTIPGGLNSTVKTITIDVAEDLAGNVMTPSPNTAHTFIVDTLAPAAPSTPDLDATSDSNITTDDVTNINTPLFVGTAEVGATVTLYEGATVLGTDVADGGGLWGITTGVLLDGPHTVTAVATDVALNDSPVSASLVVTIDTDLPSVVIATTAPNPTNTAPIPFTAEFSETVYGFDTAATDLSVTGGGSGTNPAVVDGDSYTFTVSATAPDPVDVDLSVSAVAGSAMDLAGNLSTVSNTVAITYDTVLPTVVGAVVLSDGDALVKAGDSLTFTVTFSEDMSLLPVPTIALSGTETLGATAMTRNSATEYEYTHTVGAGDGDVTVTIASGADLATNVMLPDISASLYTVDNTAPVIDAHADVVDIADSFGGATVIYSLPAATEIHPVLVDPVTCSPASGSFFAMGTTTVNCNSTDIVGNVASSTAFEVGVYPDVITKVTVVASPDSLTTANTSTLTINGKDQYDNITTNQSGQVILVSADNGGALGQTLITLVAGATTTTLTKSTSGIVHVTVTGTGPSALLTAGADTVLFTPVDVTGPIVSSFFPALNATGVSTGVVPFITFNEILKASTVNSSNVQLWELGGGQIPATVSLVEGGTQVNVTPSSALDFITSYYFVVTTGVQDEVGNALTTPLVDDSDSVFTTAENTADIDEPEVAGMNPAANSTGASLGVSPIVMFDEPLDPTTISSSSIQLWTGATPIDATVSLAEGGTQAVIDPVSPLEYSTDYYIVVTTDVKDLAGNALVDDWTVGEATDHDFTTENSPEDTDGPVISDIQVSSIGPTSATVTWTTDELSSSQVEYGQTSSYGNMTVLADIAPFVTVHTVLLSGLADLTNYHFRVISEDAETNSSTSGDNTFATTNGDTTSPEVLWTDPDDEDTNVSIDVVPTVTFDEALDPTTVSSDTVMLVDEDDNEVPATVSLVEGGTKVVITPTSPLNYDEDYYIVVTGDIKDLAGNEYGIIEEYELAEFTTESEPTGSLAVTGIDAIQTFATADDSFENGFSWLFHVTVPIDETFISMKFADFVSGANTIPAADNVQFSSEQADDTDPIGIDSANTYYGELDMEDDLDSETPGIQVEILVEVKVPVGTPGGSYSTSYGISSDDEGDE